MGVDDGVSGMEATDFVAAAHVGTSGLDGRVVAFAVGVGADEIDQRIVGTQASVRRDTFSGFQSRTPFGGDTHVVLEGQALAADGTASFVIAHPDEEALHGVDVGRGVDAIDGGLGRVVDVARAVLVHHGVGGLVATCEESAVHFGELGEVQIALVGVTYQIDGAKQLGVVGPVGHVAFVGEVHLRLLVVVVQRTVGHQHGGVAHGNEIALAFQEFGFVHVVQLVVVAVAVLVLIPVVHEVSGAFALEVDPVVGGFVVAVEVEVASHCVSGMTAVLGSPGAVRRVGGEEARLGGAPSGLGRVGVVSVRPGGVVDGVELVSRFHVVVALHFGSGDAAAAIVGQVVRAAVVDHAQIPVFGIFGVVFQSERDVLERRSEEVPVAGAFLAVVEGDTDAHVVEHVARVLREAHVFVDEDAHVGVIVHP